MFAKANQKKLTECTRDKNETKPKALKECKKKREESCSKRNDEDECDNDLICLPDIVSFFHKQVKKKDKRLLEVTLKTFQMVKGIFTYTIWPMVVLGYRLHNADSIKVIFDVICAMLDPEIIPAIFKVRSTPDGKDGWQVTSNCDVKSLPSILYIIEEDYSPDKTLTNYDEIFFVFCPAQLATIHTRACNAALTG
ncbi:hypothetical protein ACF0H5_022643 [Mactra antiquata]